MVNKIKIFLFSFLFMTQLDWRNRFANSDKWKAGEEVKPYVSEYQPQQYKLTNLLPSDTNVTGFAPGVDDLAQIVLNNKKGVKYNRNLITEAGVKYWLGKKNAKVKDGKFWSYEIADINGDGIKELVIKDGNNNIRYINGYHLTKEDRKFDIAYENYLNSKGNLEQRMVKRALGGIAPGELAKQQFLYHNLVRDENNPNGALIPISPLKDIQYKTRAPSACNLLLTYVTKDLYNNIITDDFKWKLDQPEAKAMKKIFGVIVANARVYREFVTDFVNKVLKDAGYDEKTAKKREKGQPSIYSTCSIERVQAIYKNEDGLKEKLRGVLRETMWQQYTNNIKGKFGTSEFEKKDNPRSGITEPHFEELLKSYNAPRFLSKQNMKQEEQNEDDAQNIFRNSSDDNEDIANVRTEEDFSKLRYVDQRNFYRYYPDVLTKLGIDIKDYLRAETIKSVDSLRNQNK